MRAMKTPQKVIVTHPDFNISVKGTPIYLTVTPSSSSFLETPYMSEQALQASSSTPRSLILLI
jgi:hypothetical protein